MLRPKDRLYEEEQEAAGGGDAPAQKGLPLGDPPADDAVKKLESRLAEAETASKAASERAARLEQMLSTARPQPTAPPADPNQVRQQMNEMIWNDPAGHIDQMIRVRLGQQAQAMEAQQFENNRLNARRVGSETDPLTWKMYEAEVERYMADNYPPQAQTMPNVWRHATEVVRGRHIDEIVEAKRKSREKDGPGAPSNKSMPANPSDDHTLDGEEKFVASEIFHISDDKYKEGRQFHSAQKRKSDVNGRSMLKSAWANKYYKDTNRTINGWPNKNYGKMVPMFTFDSELQRPRAAKNGE